MVKTRYLFPAGTNSVCKIISGISLKYKTTKKEGVKMLKGLKKAIGLGLAAVMTVTGLTGCVGTKVDQGGRNADGKIVIKIGGIPVERTEKDAATYDLFQENKKAFEAANPDIIVEADSWSFDLKNYLTKAAAGDLPTMFYTSPTELNTLKNSGYIKDVTALAKKYGYADGYDNEKYGELYMKDGKFYGLVKDGTLESIGIMYNKNVMKEAGLVDENGNIKTPKTWEELGEMGKTIKEKTGKIGFVMPTSKNQGGWLFLNMAWAYGVEFMKQDADGKWKATFATDEGVAALQFIKDMKWKYGALQHEAIADMTHQGKYLATDAAGMAIFSPGIMTNWVNSFELDITKIAMSTNPKGPAGKYSQRNSHVYVFTGTEEQNEACFKWLEFLGQGAEVNDVMRKNIEDQAKIKNEKGYPVGWGQIPLWKNPERIKAIEEVEAPYVNVDKADYTEYMAGDGVTYQAEPTMCAQQLYSIIDGCLQEVINNKNADCKAILEKAQNDFQLNYLDKAA